jgi:hypothetical protein
MAIRRLSVMFAPVLLELNGRYFISKVSYFADELVGWLGDSKPSKFA